ncbi:MAG: efflux RND transporter periplasmic adaptor subunit [Planctomycetaceae bacterium]
MIKRLMNALVLGLLLGALYAGHKTHWSFSGGAEAEAAMPLRAQMKPAAVRSPGSSVPTAQSRPELRDAGLPQVAALVGADADEGNSDALPAVEFKSAAEVAKAGLVVDQVQVRAMDEYVTANGVATYNQNRLAQLAARVPGIVWRVEKNVGQAVSEGDVLAILDSVEVGRAKAELLSTVVRYDLSVRNLARLKSIAASVPDRMLREAEAQVREDRVRRFNAQQTLVNLGLPIELAECEQLGDEALADRLHFLGLPESITRTLDPKKTTANLIPLIAPFAGVVIGREMVVGEMVDSSHTQFTIADVRRMWLVLNVDREDAPLIDIGQELVFRADGMPGEATSRISWISTEVDRKTRTVQVRAEVDNPSLDDGPDASEGQRLMRANMFGTGRIRTKNRPQAVAVPGEAVHTRGGRRLVFVPRDDGRTFEPRVVQTGLSQQGFTEVLAGLAPGDAVITRGSYMLKSELAANTQ